MVKNRSNSQTFAGFPAYKDISHLDNQIAILGAPFGSAYPGEESRSGKAPGAMRMESNRYADDPNAWDFDLNAALNDLAAGKVVDCGNLSLKPRDAETNRARITAAAREILNTQSIPIIIGGDDSIPIPVLAAYENENPITVIQLDAHIDWRDEVKGERHGYSSTMRRASEMQWVKGIIQVGARGVGSARKQEYQAAMAYGAKLATARDFHERGIGSVLELIPPGSRCFLTIDYDVLDPSIMPAVGAPAPGGLFYQETIDLLQAVAERTSIAGACLVELVPEADVNHLGVITAMRIAWNLIGLLATSRKIDQNTIKE